MLIEPWMRDLALELISDPKPNEYEAILHIIARHAPHHRPGVPTRTDDSLRGKDKD